MGDFVAFSDEIDEGMEFLEHYGIMGQRWGHRNGPPYPLSRTDHSKAEIGAAKKFGFRLGGSSGTGSIEKAKKKKSGSSKSSPKKEMTPEEKRAAALEALRKGDKKKIAKYMDELTTDELRDAQNRAQMKEALTKQEPGEKKMSKEDVEKEEAIRSGDKEKVKQYADKMTYQELKEAMDKVDLTTKLNHVDPPPSVFDKIKDVANKVDTVRDAAEKGIKAYNVVAKVHNATSKEGEKWPVIENQQPTKEQKKEQDVAEKLLNNLTKDTAKNIEEAKSYQEKSDEKLKEKKIDYENQKKYEEWVAKQEKNNNKNDEKTNKELEKRMKNLEEQMEKNQRNEEDEKPAPAPQPSQPTNYSQYTQKMSDYDDMSYDELIPDDVRDVMNRKVS